MYCLRSLGSRDSGFESHSGHGYLVFVYVCRVCVQVEALRRADHPSKESYQLFLIKKLRKLSPMLQKREQTPKCGSNEGKKILCYHLNLCYPGGFTTNILHNFYLSHGYYMSYPSHLPWFYHSNNIWRRENLQIIKFFTSHSAYLNKHKTKVSMLWVSLSAIDILTYLAQFRRQHVRLLQEICIYEYHMQRTVMLQGSVKSPSFSPQAIASCKPLRKYGTTQWSSTSWGRVTPSES
jgi:hypothetical protein